MNKSIGLFSMTLFPAIVFFLIASCQNQSGMVELEKMRTMLKVEAQNKALVKQILAEGDKKNLNIFDELSTPDYKFRFPSNAKPINREQHKELWQAFNVAFPDLTHTIEEIYAEGDIVVASETLRGTHKGEFSKIPPTGKKVEFSAVAIYRFYNGKLAELWVDADLLGMYQQLGMELKPKEKEK